MSKITVLVWDYEDNVQEVEIGHDFCNQCGTKLGKDCGEAEIDYNDEFCSNMCRDDWFNDFGKRAIDHFGRIHEPKRTDASGAWYKYRDWRGDSNNTYYFANDLLGERRPITDEQYQDENYTTPN